MNDTTKDLFSIGELAKAVGITRKIILNYEAKGLITPDRKESATANRYYTIDTLTQIRSIRMFQDLGLSLDEIHDYLTDRSDLCPTIKRLEEMRNKLDLMIEKLKERTSDTGGDVKLLKIEPQTVYMRAYDSRTIEEKTSLLRNTALEAMRKFGVDTTRRLYFTEFSQSEPHSVRYGISVPKESVGANIVYLPAQKAIYLFHHGAYEDIPQTQQKLVQWAHENDIRFSGVFRNVYLEGPPQHKDKSKFITQTLALLE